MIRGKTYATLSRAQHSNHYATMPPHISIHGWQVICQLVLWVVRVWRCFWGSLCFKKKEAEGIDTLLLSCFSLSHGNALSFNQGTIQPLLPSLSHTFLHFCRKTLLKKAVNLHCKIMTKNNALLTNCNETSSKKASTIIPQFLGQQVCCYSCETTEEGKQQNKNILVKTYTRSMEQVDSPSRQVTFYSHLPNQNGQVIYQLNYWY